MMKRSFGLLAAAAGAVALATAGCGGGGGSAANPSNGTPVGVQSGSGATQSAGIAAGASTHLSGVLGATGHAPALSPLAKRAQNPRLARLDAATTRLGRFGSASLAKVRAQAAGVSSPLTGSGSCTSGSWSYTGTQDTAAGTGSVTYTFANCADTVAGETQLLNGTATFSFSPSGFTMSMGNHDGIIDAASDLTARFYYGTGMTGPFDQAVMDFTESGDSSFDSATGTYMLDVTADGKMQYTTASGDSATLAYTGFSLHSVATASNGTDIVNGGYSESWTVGGVEQGMSATFTALTTTWADDGSGFQHTLNGTVALTSKGDFCGAGADGTFTFVTTTPMYYDYALGYTTAGVLEINDATLTYNGDGSVDFVDSSGTSHHFGSFAEMVNQCPVAAA